MYYFVCPSVIQYEHFVLHIYWKYYFLSCYEIKISNYIVNITKTESSEILHTLKMALELSYELFPINVVFHVVNEINYFQEKIWTP